MEKFTLLALSVLGSTLVLLAQNENDALNFSQTTIAGTARAQGSGGAFGAVGADFSSSIINPAGLGLYRRNELMFGSSITNNVAKSTYFGNTLTDNRSNFNLPTWGGVTTEVFSEMGQDVKSGLVSLSFAAGMNRVNSYQQNIRFSGVNNQNSLLDYFKNSANGINASDIIDNFAGTQNNYSNIPGAAAYYYYLLDTANNSNSYKALTDGVSGYKLLQQQQTQIRGGANEFNVSGGANLSNIVYLGAGLIIRDVYSETNTLFTENAQATVPNYNSSSLRQEINSTGRGVGGRFGIIIRPVDFLKLGLAAQSPIRLDMRDEYKFTVTSNNSAFGNTLPNTNITHDPFRLDFFEYQIISPSKLTASAAITISSIGFISVDYETADYTQMRIKSDNDFFTAANAAIANTMTRASNLRIGAEVKVAEFYRIRGGYALYESPYKNKTINLDRNAITAGVGFVVDRVFVDFALVNSFGNQSISPYITGDASKPNPQVVNNYNIYNFVLSGGIRF